MAYENVDIECKRILGPLKIRPTSMDEWVLHTMNVNTVDYGTESWVGEAISNGERRHQNTKCFDCGRVGYLRKDCRQWIPMNSVSSGNGRNRRTQTSGICRRCGKGQHWTNECRSMKNRQGNPIPSGNAMEVLWQAPMTNVVQSFPETVEDVSLQKN